LKQLVSVLSRSRALRRHEKAEKYLGKLLVEDFEAKKKD
jgi:hypothetical protein